MKLLKASVRPPNSERTAGVPLNPVNRHAPVTHWSARSWTIGTLPIGLWEPASPVSPPHQSNPPTPQSAEKLLMRPFAARLLLSRLQPKSISWFISSYEPGNQRQHSAPSQTRIAHTFTHVHLYENNLNSIFPRMMLALILQMFTPVMLVETKQLELPLQRSRWCTCTPLHQHRRSKPKSRSSLGLFHHRHTLFKGHLQTKYLFTSYKSQLHLSLNAPS